MVNKLLKVFGISVLYLLFASCAGDNPIDVDPIDKYLYKIESIDNKLITIGTEGKIYLSNDGIKWNKLDSKVSNTLLDIFSLDNNLAYITGEKGIFLKSTDGGNTWISSQIPSNQSFRTIFFIDKEKGWVTGNNGKIYLTNDGGNSWADTSFTEDVIFTEIYFDKSGFGFVVGSKDANFTEAVMYSTNDFGQNWTEVDLSIFEIQGISSVKYFGNKIFLIAGNKILTFDKSNSIENIEIIADNTLLDSTFRFSSLNYKNDGLVSETIIAGFQGHNLGMIYNKELNTYTKTNKHMLDCIKFNSREVYVGGYGYSIMQKNNTNFEYINLE